MKIIKSYIYILLNFFSFGFRKNLKIGNLSLCTSCNIIDKGRGNIILINHNSRLRRCSFEIYGNNNIISIDENCVLNDTSFWVSDDGNNIQIGAETTVSGKTQFAALEGTKINIGKDCMFSHDIYVRTSDSHSIIDIENKRINNAKDIKIGNHCWIGMQSLILKGACIGENSIVGARSVVTKQFEKSLLIAGHPAKVLKSQINWKRERV